MGNHPHIIVVAKDKKACTQFYGELQKQLTEAVKRLCGLEHLTLWKSNGTSVIAYHDEETVCYRIAYLYANPARADLVDTIQDYPGFSSWREFKRNKDSLEAASSEEYQWIRAPFIEQLPRLAVNRIEDMQICGRWKKIAKDSHELVVEPNAWMRAFKIRRRGCLKAQPAGY
jgi:hypothetical protein